MINPYCPAKWFDLEGGEKRSLFPNTVWGGESQDLSIRLFPQGRIDGCSLAPAQRREQACWEVGTSGADLPGTWWQRTSGYSAFRAAMAPEH